jgi:large conductance mechanosensitive channel
LAIGIIIGTAFTHVVQSLVDDIITPPFGLILGGVDFVNLTVKMKNFVHKDQPPVVIRYGKFIQTIMSLFIVTLALFFVVKGANKLHQLATKKKKNKENEEMIQFETTEEVKVLCQIRDLLAKQSSVVQ